jgi:hypothetical protein
MFTELGKNQRLRRGRGHGTKLQTGKVLAANIFMPFY